MMVFAWFVAPSRTKPRRLHSVIRLAKMHMLIPGPYTIHHTPYHSHDGKRAIEEGFSKPGSLIVRMRGTGSSEYLIGITMCVQAAGLDDHSFLLDILREFCLVQNKIIPSIRAL